MLEQEKPATPEEMTQLEGIRQKVSWTGILSKMQMGNL